MAKVQYMFPKGGKIQSETLKLFYGMNAILAEGVRSGSEDNKTTFGDQPDPLLLFHVSYVYFARFADFSIKPRQGDALGQIDLARLIIPPKAVLYCVVWLSCCVCLNKLSKDQFRVVSSEGNKLEITWYENA